MSSIEIPYIISSRLVDDAVRAGPTAVEAFLSPHVNQIDRSWKSGTRVEVILLACASLRRALGKDLPVTEAGVRLTLVEADATLAAARSTSDADRAFDLAEQAQAELVRLQPSSQRHLDLLSEAMLVAGVALKAIGMFDESIEYMRSQIADRSLSKVESISLDRQEVMMFQEQDAHLILLNDASLYRDLRPVEYFRTLKRVFEFLLSSGRVRASVEVAPEMGRAYQAAAKELSALGHVSFLKNVAQAAAARGEVYRALRVLYVCERLAIAAGFAGQLRQIRSLMASLEGESRMVLPTFSLPRAA